MPTLRIGFVIPPTLSIGRYIEAEDCCWGAMGKRVLPAMLPACASQMGNAFFMDLSIDRPRQVYHEKPDLLVFPVIWAYHWEIMGRMTTLFPKIPKVVIPIPFGYADALATNHYRRVVCVINSEPEAVFKKFWPTTSMDLLEWREAARGVTWYSPRSGLHRGSTVANCMGSLKQTDFELIPRHYWRYYKRAVMYQVTRACPYRCTFCVWGSSTVTDRKYRMRPARQVAQALHQIRRRANFSLRLDPATPEPVVVRLLSAQLTTRLDWIKEFHRLMKPFPYPFQGNVNLFELTKEKIELLMEAGMYSASAGFEGLTDTAMRMMRKPHTFEQALEGALILERSGINYKLNFRFGYGESDDDARQAIINLWRIYRAGIHRPKVKLAPLMYYRGTIIEEHPPCATVQDPRFSVPVRRMKNPPQAWDQALRLIRNVFQWGRP